MARKAFLVGVNAYLPPISSLNGCVNDVLQMKGVLEAHYSFDTERIKLLLNEDATREAILAGLDWLVEGAQAGDVLVFHYSGHGSYVADDGDDEFDCTDEILVTHDQDWADPLRDDHIKNKFAQVPPGANVTFISDSCHSGTVNRLAAMDEVPRSVFVPEEIQRSVAVKVARRNADFRAFLQERSQEIARAVGTEALDEAIDRFLATALDQFKLNRYQFVDTRENNILLAACQDQQTSVETVAAGEWHGVFTHNLVNAITHGGGQMTYQDVIDEISGGLLQHLQVPQLECPAHIKNVPIFSPLVD